MSTPLSFVRPSLNNPTTPNTDRQAKIQAVQSALNGPYNAEVWDTAEREEHQRNFQKLLAHNEQSGDVILKAPGRPAFVRWDQDGFSKSWDLDTAKGYFAQDTQYIQDFTVSDEHGHLPQTQQKHVAPDRQSSDYIYRFANEPNLKVSRHEALTPEGLLESFHIQNPDAEAHTVSINLKTGFRDFFQVRSGVDPKIAPLKDVVQFQPHSPKAGLGEEIDGSSSPFARAPQTPNIFTLKEKHQESRPIREETTLNATHDQATSRWVVDMPPHTASTVFSLNLGMQNTLATSRSMEAAAKQQAESKMSLPVVTVQTSNDAAGQAIQHLQNTLAVSARDLQMLTLAVRNPNPQNGMETFFTPVGAGIPNYVAPFGRDSLITSLFTLQFQPEIAKQALLTLAAYQGQRHNPVTEEEPGKIMHELRQGELTRLGYTPHRPSYTTLDATPLFVILYDAYLQRTGDTQLGEALKPNAQAALNWMERNTQKDPHGFLTQRDDTDTAQLGGGKYKNIGWKDSQYALRHRLQDGKLVDPPYPVAPAEIQAQVQQAWQAGARQIPEKAALYSTKAEQMKQSFQALWMPQQQWPASAMDAHNQPVASVASNGAQALWSDVLTPDQAQRMQARALQPDLLSGWGMRTLSAKEPAYNPISYHNGTIWPHDNALIALGAKRNHCEVLTQTLADQVLQSARLFPQNRLPELYAGLPRQDMAGIKDKSILEYPETCTIQAWASATPYAMLTALLGMDICQRNGRHEIRFQNPSLPSGVNALEIKGIPVSDRSKLDILARRDAANLHQVNLWLRPSQASAQWMPYRGQ